MGEKHLRDWTALGGPERRVAWDQCQRIAKLLQPTLSVFLEISDQRSAPSTGSLSGLPYAVKDMFQSPERTPTCGLSVPLSGSRATAEACVLARLDRAGARRVGYTRMTALAYEPSGHNPLQGAPLNPWCFDFVPGASSSGSAVAVASGAAFVALGSDTGGSLRIPAQGCGVTAWKPSAGMVPLDGAMPLAPSLDTVGLLARSAGDAKVVAAHIADGIDDDSAAGMPNRMAVLGDALNSAEPAVRQACEAGVAIFSDIGVSVELIDGMALLDAAGDEAMTVMQAEAARSHQHQLGDPALDRMLSRRLRKGLDIEDAALSASLARREPLLAQVLDQLLGGIDMMALPVMPIRTPPLKHTDPASPEFQPRTLYAMSAFTRFANFLGLPGVAVPVSSDDRGMPVGLQLIGAPGSDMMLLNAAIAMQSESSWHGRLPRALQQYSTHYGDLLI